MSRALYIIRGLPGSGKTTLAKALAPHANAANDDYFYGPNGYKYDSTRHFDARSQCARRVANFMRDGHPNVAVHNTFIKHKAYAEYLELAKQFGYKVIIVSMQAQLGSVHNVPPDVMRSMAADWEP
jgi:predicted kinase